MTGMEADGEKGYMKLDLTHPVRSLVFFDSNVPAIHRPQFLNNCLVAANEIADTKGHNKLVLRFLVDRECMWCCHLMGVFAWDGHVFALVRHPENSDDKNVGIISPTDYRVIPSR